ncbi:MAG TPA: hypothetical protein VE397_06180 [Stellaceae bacterium]|nr:hypothetical protein [Stellaceae bacterium]
MLDADHYREQAAQMRKFAAEALNESMRAQFLNLAAEYDKLVKRAQARKPSGA